eukprot:gb/GEZN01010099.1/.p1 GENE.gb/GEZN01010099.1/~~gb/GEZN01010099.1/.p1  ORF type:complete len:362 (-),score=75.41 gb/GEZN01010099.1/:146-1231(-)
MAESQLTEELITMGKRLKKATSKEDFDEAEAIAVLDTLDKTTVTPSALKVSRVGQLVNDIRKSSTDPLKRKASSICKKWVKQVKPVGKTNSKPATPKISTSTPPTTSTPPKASTPTTPTSSAFSSRKPSTPTPTPTTPTTSTTSWTKPTIKAKSPTSAEDNSRPKLEVSSSSPKPAEEGKLTESNSTDTESLGGVGCTGDKIRDKIQQSFYEALGTGQETIRAEVAVQIENAMFKQCRGTSAQYKAKFRTLIWNVRDPKNPELNMSLLDKQISPEQFVNMDENDMCSSEVKKKRAEELQWALDARRTDWDAEAGATDLFECGKCKQTKTTYHQLQTRSADEPMTTFVTCLNQACGHRWRFC